VLGVLCASIGSIMVNEAIKLITGIGDDQVTAVATHLVGGQLCGWFDQRGQRHVRLLQAIGLGQRPMGFHQEQLSRLHRCSLPSPDACSPSHTADG
jgi:hypothetical protein